mmetsp:Transcript_20565/g.53601  ORF Transcript_20565/g.53601 Transcript_20565/m.53601 type:complete len:86 (-) Transcript_20565:1750-2007(-)|eukprot:45093-Pelagomonas_calceolata.AAC.8
MVYSENAEIEWAGEQARWEWKEMKANRVGTRNGAVSSCVCVITPDQQLGNHAQQLEENPSPAYIKSEKKGLGQTKTGRMLYRKEP